MTLKLMPHQISGAAWLARNARAILADEMGTGKTATAIEACRLAGAMKVLVVCPAVARGVWKTEWPRWMGLDWRVEVVRTQADVRALSLAAQPCVFVCSYDLFSQKGRARLSAIRERLFLIKARFDAIVCDEAHYLKSLDANRTTEVLSLESMTLRMWMLTGTPVPNHYGELYPMLRYLWPERLPVRKVCTDMGYMSRREFEDEFCVVREIPVDGRRVRTISGSRNGARLTAMLKGLMLRRKLSEVVKDMPPLLTGTLPVAVDGNLIPEAYRIAGALPVGGYESDDAFLARMRQALAPSGGGLHVSQARQALGLLKVAPALEYAEEILAPDPKAKLVVFVWHIAVLDALMRVLAQWKPVKIDGRDGDAARAKAVAGFQEGDNRAFVGQITACGTAVSLHAARHALFVEASWVPAENHQAAARCRRIGQKRTVVATFMSVENSLDERVARVLARKTDEIAEIFV
jgi:SNF2 family DNA or RNA helicase